MGATKEIAEWVCSTKYSDFDQDLIKHTKVLCLDGLGMAAGAVNMGQSQAMIKYVKECAAPPEAGVVGAGFRTSVEYAALANGSIAHTSELEADTFPEGTYMVSVFPTAFALGEKLHLPGKDVIMANIIGYEVTARLALACLAMFDRGFTTAPLTGAIGCAAMAAKILNLGVYETMMALSLAASQAGGLLRQTGTGAHLYEAGLAGRNGISAALLAKHGMTGQPNIIEGFKGLCYATAGVEEPDLKLGTFRIRDVEMKWYPCCFLEQQAIYTVQELIRENNIAADEVDSVRVEIYPQFQVAVKYQHPENEDQARFSLPHSIAAAFLDGKIFLGSYTDEKVKDPRFLAFRDKVKMVVHEDWSIPTGEGLVGRDVPVTIKLTNGKEYSKVAPAMDAAMPHSEEMIIEKFNTCMDEGGFSRAQAKKAAKLIKELDEIEDVLEIMNIFTYPEK